MKKDYRLWKLSTLIFGLASVLFCTLWIVGLVPADNSAEWIAAISAVAALVAAGIAAATALEQLAMLRRDAEARARDERIRQARQVFLIETPPKKDGDVIQRGECVLYNNSSEPVERVDFYLQTPGTVLRLMTGITLPPTGADGYSAPHVADIIASEAAPWQHKMVNTQDGREAMWGTHPYWLFMIFEDSAGRKWIRREGVGLTEAEGDVMKYLPSKPAHIDGTATLT